MFRKPEILISDAKFLTKNKKVKETSMEEIFRLMTSFHEWKPVSIEDNKLIKTKELLFSKFILKNKDAIFVFEILPYSDIVSAAWHTQSAFYFQISLILGDSILMSRKNGSKKDIYRGKSILNKKVEMIEKVEEVTGVVLKANMSLLKNL